METAIVAIFMVVLVAYAYLIIDNVITMTSIRKIVKDAKAKLDVEYPNPDNKKDNLPF